MADEKPLNDTEVWNRLYAAVEALGTAPGATKAGDTALRAARRALIYFQMGVLKSAQDTQEPFKGQAESSPRQP